MAEVYQLVSLMGSVPPWPARLWYLTLMFPSGGLLKNGRASNGPGSFTGRVGPPAVVGSARLPAPAPAGVGGASGSRRAPTKSYLLSHSRTSVEHNDEAVTSTAPGPVGAVRRTSLV